MSANSYHLKRFALLTSAIALTLFVGACQQTHPLVQARNAKIAQEPRGDYFIGRRYFVKGSRVWGWLRKPGQPWADARLCVFNETIKHTPDRVKEGTSQNGVFQGSDHNREYRISGSFTGDDVYDPTTNLVLPEFRLQGYEMVDKSPGFLFEPDERQSNERLLRAYPITIAPQIP